MPGLAFGPACALPLCLRSAAAGRSGAGVLFCQESIIRGMERGAIDGVLTESEPWECGSCFSRGTGRADGCVLGKSVACVICERGGGYTDAMQSI